MGTCSLGQGPRQKRESHEKIELRYYVEKDQYYIQIQSRRFKELNKMVNRLRKAMNSLKNPEHEAELEHLREKYQLLIQEREKAQRYVKVAREDIPEGVPARSMVEIRGVLVVVTPQRYRELMETLRERRNLLETDTSAPALGPAGGAAADPAGQCVG